MRSMRKGTPIVAVALCMAMAGLVACTHEPTVDGNVGPTPSTGTSADLDPSNFALPVDNRYFPLQPGTTYRHEGIKDGERAVDVFAVTDRTKTILSIPNTVVVDKLYVDGRLEEIAHDWYTQDVHGNVWYFGEAIQEFDRRGNPIPAKGAWQAGVDGARPGIVMPAHPMVGEITRPEYYRGTAEDRYRILDLSARVKTPYGTFSKVLVMSEQSRLEPGIFGLKFHAPGIGQIKESVPVGPHETLSLVSVTRGS